MWQVVGHDWAVDLLKRSLENGRVSHAYLLTGPPQIGKTTLALNFAQALNCPSEDRPCGECLSCRKIARHIHPDVRIIEGKEGTIGIDQIRDMQREVALSPYEGRWRVYIIREMERATTEAANCLLKTLEEPPSQVILLLTAHHADALPPTIVSRCQVLNLRPLPAELIQGALQQRWQVDEDKARLLARLSGGRIGWAIEANQDEAILKGREGQLREMLALMEKGRVGRLDYAYQLSRQADAVPEVLDLWLSWWRDLLLVKGGCPEAVTNIDQQAALQEMAGRYTLEQVRGFIKAIQDTAEQLERHVNPRLALEVLMLSLPKTS